MSDAAQCTISEQRGEMGRPGVPLAFVHRARGEDAFVTDWQRTAAEGSFAVSGRWPGAHPFTPSIDLTYDPLLVAETMRQAGILIVHAAYALPLEYRFLLSKLRYSCVPELLRVDAWPADVDILVRCSDIVWRGLRPRSMKVAMTVRRGGNVVARGDVDAEFINPGTYVRLRGDRAVPRSWVSPAAPVRPLLAGRTRADDVLIAPTPDPCQWLLRVDTAHPVLFQGRKDHVPGMLLLEAARQAASALRSPTPFVPAGGEITFQRYAEFDVPCLIRAERPAADGGIRISGEQNGAPVFSATLQERALLDPPVEAGTLVGTGGRSM
ncbi:ScbA/BarX family gamma-butyrolactone biosynthesis protein [Streptomyces sp. NPDC002506]|uniref:ScbA/BarX family gamma-butyrolactone biosynthesis protein n=1 Tax=Streptomyces sp. NPDC002506 TaxID=3154536 RepID=UPI003325B9FC